VIRTLIVDDEPLARDALRLHIQREPLLELIGECRTGREAVEAIRALAPDLLFLDVRMPDLSGFEVLERLAGVAMPHVVFVTAYDEYALRAFEVHALAYLLKPFDDVRFAESMRHVKHVFTGRETAGGAQLATLVAELRDLLDKRPDAASAGAPPGMIEPPDERPLTRFIVKSGLRTRLVAASDVDWIEASGNYAKLHCGTETLLVSRSMRELADALAPRQFVRIHRSAIVNVERIRELRTDDYRDYTVLLRDGQQLRLSRSYRQALEAALGDRI
jgi:two-component system LytT family response regulator